MMIYLFTLIVFSSRQLPPPSLRAHLNNYYNPEECKLRGTHSGEKLGPWITHLHFPPRGIQTFILWSHPWFRDSNNEPLLHCIAILANKLALSLKTDSKLYRYHISTAMLFPPTFLNSPRRMAMRWEPSMMIMMTVTSPKVTWLQRWSPTNGQEVIRQQLVSSDQQRRHGEEAPGAGKYKGEGHFWGDWKVLTPQFSVKI